jgi:2-polyprenyl-3-methyl-5-hydroxy-6-metoxy-1,4-benzoquinol methylase
MGDEDRARWDQRHRGQTPIVAPPEGVDEGLLPVSGKALDVACGTGGVAIWLAERGLEVTGLDISAVALSILNAEANARSLHVKTIAADLITDIPVDGLFDVVICQRFRSPAIFARLVSLLKPDGGVLVVTVLSQVGYDGPASRFRALPSELYDAFSPLLRVLAVSEGEGISTAVARREDGSGLTS